MKTETATGVEQQPEDRPAEAKQSPSSADSNRDASSERVVTCSRCVTLRGVDKPNDLHQKRDAALNLWLPQICADCSQVIEEKQKSIAADERRREASERVERELNRLRAAGLPEPYVVGKRGYLTLDDGPKTDSYRSARDTCQKLITGKLDAPWIYLCGENGTYKSTLACVSLLMTLQAGLDGRYEFWPNTLNELRALNRDDAPESVAHYINRLVTVPRLVFDEIGFGTPTNFAVETLGVVFERRYQLDSAAEPGQRWTIFTSNRTLDELVKSFAAFDDFKMAPRLERRIAEMSTEIVIQREAA